MYPHRTVEVIDWLTRDEFKPLVDKVRRASSKEERELLKTKLPSITVSGVFDKRSTANLRSTTNLVLLDIDKLPTDTIEALKRLLFDRFPFVILAMLSCSGTGLLLIVEIADYRNQHFHYLALEEDFAKAGVILDSSCKDLPRIRFASYDSNPLIRDNAPIYAKMLDNGTLPNNVKERDNDNKRPCTGRPNKRWQEKPLTVQEQIKLLINPKRVRWNTLIPPTEYTIPQWVVYSPLAKIANTDFDVTELYLDWIRIAALLARYLGEGEGRELFHDVSRHHCKYDPSECDSLYYRFLNKPNNNFSINQLKLMSEHYGF